MFIMILKLQSKMLSYEICIYTFICYTLYIKTSIFVEMYKI